MHRPTWRGPASEHQWRPSLERYVHPRISNRPVHCIDGGDVMDVLPPIWTEKHVTARVQQRVGAVMQWAIARGYREDKPAGDAISAALPKVDARPAHHGALPIPR